MGQFKKLPESQLIETSEQNFSHYLDFYHRLIPLVLWAYGPGSVFTSPTEAPSHCLIRPLLVGTAHTVFRNCFQSTHAVRAASPFPLCLASLLRLGAWLLRRGLCRVCVRLMPCAYASALSLLLRSRAEVPGFSSCRHLQKQVFQDFQRGLGRTHLPFLFS